MDYKLASRAIAGRLLKVIQWLTKIKHVVSLGGSLARMLPFYGTWWTSPYRLMSLWPLSLDHEKAFDRVDWRFMLATLSKMGFDSSFIRWVDLFYTGVRSAIIVNGYLSGFFSLSGGVRQGCPLSPLLYVLVSEVLAVNIRVNPAITGLSLPGVPALLSPITQYADDTPVLTVPFGHFLVLIRSLKRVLERS